MDKPPQFTLSFIFRQVFLVAVILALVRIYPAWELKFSAFETWNRVIIFTCVGTVAGVLIGGFISKPRVGGLVGFALSLPTGLMGEMFQGMQRAIPQ